MYDFILPSNISWAMLFDSSEILGTKISCLTGSLVKLSAVLWKVRGLSFACVGMTGLLGGCGHG